MYTSSSSTSFTVEPPVIPIYVDIKPGGWPNPLNVKAKGVLPVAICGTADFDVTTIDPTTLEITREGFTTGVQPLRWSIEDVATPWTGVPGGGHNLKHDGYPDLCVKFENQEIVSTLLLASLKGHTIPLTIKGSLHDTYGGNPLEGRDYVRIQ